MSELNLLLIDPLTLDVRPPSFFSFFNSFEVSSKFLLVLFDLEVFLLLLDLLLLAFFKDACSDSSLI